MELKKNDEVSLEIIDLTNTGEGIGKIDGFPLFVKDCVPGDRIRAKVMKVKKNYGFARLMEVEEPSADRVKPECPVARPCGGCQLQAMSYEAELRYKTKKVHDCLLRIGGIPEKILKNAEEPIISMEKPWRYRNKAQYPIGLDKDGNVIAGFYAGHTHSIISSDDCLLTPPEFQVILNTVLEFIRDFKIKVYNEESGKGLVRHLLIKKGFESGELMACLVVTSEKLPHKEELVERLRGIPGMKTVCLNINPDKTNIILGKKIEVLYGDGYIVDMMDGLKFRISPLSFYQVNQVQAVKLYKKALEYADLNGDEEVWDVCCGIGTISLFLSRKAGKVHGLEIVLEAIEDAKVNAELNGIRNVDFVAAAAEDYMPSHKEIRADVVVVDPPRAGLDPSVLETIVGMSPEKVVYVSCDPATLARDLKILLAAGYKLKKYAACDQFSRTGHVEAVVLLAKSEAQSK
ncbi:MAG: 23S rRNA (uracil(1939)-C(5))-methyltransferase RlmD [Lachnospiraceae bacterium]|nr:23S rRNA (uracil(1939)-C(5))-methyltransferase RlmD [Lachnospiraceae bacterium]